MANVWQAVSTGNVSQSCLQANLFAPFPYMSSSYCAFRVPAIQYAQICCLADVVKDSQDDCTYVCPYAVPGYLLGCMHTVLGTLDPTPNGGQSAGIGQTMMSGEDVQMTCYDATTHIFFNSSRQIGPGPPPPPSQNNGPFRSDASRSRRGTTGLLLLIALIAIISNG